MSLNYSANGLEFRISDQALDVFDRFRQRHFWQREAGGQLFARVRKNTWHIEVATPPARLSIRTRYGFTPNRKAEQVEIERLYQDGLEYVGDWHTHPQDVPSPSKNDLASIGNVVRESTHHFPGFLMCIVGRQKFPEGLWVSFHAVSGKAIELMPGNDRATVP